MRRPAQAGLYSKQLTWITPEPALLLWLNPLLDNYPGRQEVAFSSTHDGRPAYARIFTHDSQKPHVFVKLIPKGYATQERLAMNVANEIVARLACTPLPCNEILLEDSTNAFVYEWIDGRSPHSSIDDINLLGKSLARFHSALKVVAPQFGIRERTRSRLLELANIAKSSDFSAIWTGKSDEAFAVKMRDAFLLNYDDMLSNAIPCHGDLNIGNLLVHNDERVYFIDLEDTLHTEVWAGFDLAKIIERVALPVTNMNDKNHIKEIIINLYESYGNAGGELSGSFSLMTKNLVKAMRWHIGLAILILTKNQNLVPFTVSTEMAKFKIINKLIDKFEMAF